jgi:Ca-activated chloride channel family protein
MYGAPKECNKPARRILILISDGNDNSSRVTREEAIAKAVSSGAVVFSLGTSLVSIGPFRGDKTMEDFAERTGGKYYSEVQAKDAAKTFADISRRLSDMYFVSYSSSSRHASG